MSKKIPNIDFIGKKNYALTFSGILTILSVLLLIFKGLNLSIDFKGGTIIEFWTTKSEVEDSLKDVCEGDFVYLDPPYAPEKDNSFVKYTTDGFDLTKHQHLFNLCNEFRTKKVKMLMSNADVLLVREAFSEEHYDIATLSCRRAIHSKEPASRTNEVLILSR